MDTVLKKFEFQLLFNNKNNNFLFQKGLILGKEYLCERYLPFTYSII